MDGPHIRQWVALAGELLLSVGIGIAAARTMPVLAAIGVAVMVAVICGLVTFGMFRRG